MRFSLAIFPERTRGLLPGVNCIQGSPLARLRPMANKDRSNHEPPEKPGGEGWLFSRAATTALSLQALDGHGARAVG